MFHFHSPPNRASRTWPALLLCLFAALLLSACGDDQPDATAQAQAESTPPPSSRAVSVLVTEVRPVTLRDVLTLPGATEPQHDVTVSAERGGRVEWVGPTEGDSVRQGEIIAKIDMDKAEADLAKARSAYELAVKQAKRRKQLRAKNLLSQEELDQANTDLESATSDLTQAQVYYDQGLVASPISGRVNDLAVDPGEYLNTGQAVAELVNISRIRIYVNVPELDVRYLHVGQRVKVTVDAYPNEVWDGEVDFVAYKADESTKTFRTRVVVDNDDSRIRPGMLARVRLERRVVKDAVSAPLFAIVDKGGERILFVEENGVARSRAIEIGFIDGDRAQILHGLKLGEQLIVSGQDAVEEGVSVEAQPVGDALPGADLSEVDPNGADPESRILSTPEQHAATAGGSE
ncbi:membrane fusion protein, multidrug efflux system [Paucidesulfovibrio gracilis DSM 16080]|uniref:Membrane fusion protein, multidrug efflux system n=1 Tax=Paucidesulfovibrio gracilis DSM 16080 TaxID=1121449 RepID=A0A1T4W6C8_9BACT|nr:efflux RND transporter periplasmic adaptor subunit [Paucidesulfovibrio gracilis]SKA72271.1 membrane fusion protein, multidrug efflux system [Paucidesulfovibrio gracilis DSM 16080]